jgi:hypothetical protein
MGGEGGVRCDGGGVGEWMGDKERAGDGRVLRRGHW